MIYQKSIKKIVKNIKNNRPYTKIYLESIYPINNSNDEKIDKTIINSIDLILCISSSFPYVF